jgi:hypothetical protein
VQLRWRSVTLAAAVMAPADARARFQLYHITAKRRADRDSRAGKETLGQQPHHRLAGLALLHLHVTGDICKARPGQHSTRAAPLC